MTPRQRIWLALTGLGSLLLLLTWWAWWTLSSAAFTPTRANTVGQRATVPIVNPPSVRPEVFYNDRVVRQTNQPQALRLSYVQTRVGDEVELRIEAHNRAPAVANINLYLYPGTLAIQPFKHHRIAAQATQAETSDLRAQLGIGFHVFGEPDGYLGEWVGEEGRVAWQLSGPQAIETDYVAAADGRFQGKAASKLAPRVSLINLEPGAHARATLRWRAVEVFDDAADAGVVDGSPAPVLTVGSDRRLRVRLSAVPPINGTVAREQVLILKDAEGRSWRQALPALRWEEAGRRALALDWPLPADVRPGHYTLSFGVTGGADKRWLPMRPGEDAAADSDGSIRVGTVRVLDRPVGMSIGMSFHRYPGRSEAMFGPIRMGYDFARSLAVHGLHAVQWWKGPDDYSWSTLDAWANYHAKDGRGLIMVFTGTPTWASQRPQEDSVMKVPGYAAPIRHDLYGAYGRMVAATLTRLKGKLTAVECWNEPDLRGSFTGTATEMADLCKIVSVQSRSVVPGVPVICPQAAAPRGMPFVLGARTSQGEPITQYCDMVGAHVYGALGDDPRGRPYDAMTVSSQVRQMHAHMRLFGLQDRPLAITEYGVASCGARPLNGYAPFIQMPSQTVGEALYQSLKAFREGGVSLIGLYSYDHEDNDRRCRPGGSFIRLTTSNIFGDQAIDEAVLQRLEQARRDFGTR